MGGGGGSVRVLRESTHWIFRLAFHVCLKKMIFGL